MSICDARLVRFVKFAVNVMGVEPQAEEKETALADQCVASTRNNLGKVRHLTKEDMIAIYQEAR